MRKLVKLAPGLAVVALAAVPTGCLDLKEEIVTGVTAEYFETDAGARDAVSATYSYLRAWLPRVEEWMSNTQLGTDIWLEGNDGQHKYFNRYDGNLNAAAPMVTWIWDAIYEGVNTANTAIARVSAASFDEATRNRLIAEARFLRGLMYLDLVRHYGDVHLSLEPSVGVVTEATRTPAADVFAQAIIPDLEFAAATLDAAPAGGEFGRATRGAANHFLGVALLTRGGSGDAERAATVLQDVVNSGVYQLESDYARTFALDNERSSEIVFSVQFTTNPSAWGFGNRLHLYWGMVYDTNFPGMTRDIANGRPFRRIRPSPCLLELWDRDADVRYGLSFKTVWYANHAPSLRPGMALGDTAIYMPGHDVSDAEIAASRYALIPPRLYNPIHFPTLTKHLDPTRPSVGQEQSGRDFIIARLADTRLLLAEALIRAGRPGDAVQHVNDVRVRAAQPGQDNAMRVTAAEMTLDFILDERARELAGEGSEPRWFTLKRFGQLLERVRACNPTAAENIQPHHLLRPIPSTQIDRSSTAFPQNPGY